MGRASLLVLGMVAAGVLGWWAWATGTPEARPGGDGVEVEADRPASGRWIAVGGGSSPEMNQVSIEQDLALAAEVLGDDGTLLFTGGPGSHGVQVLDDEPRGDPLMRELGQLFSPRRGRDSHYRKTTLAVDGPATAGAALERIGAELARDARDPLLLYFAGHGEQGDQPRDNLVRLWGRTTLTVAHLVAALDKADGERMVRLVATTCFSGGFSEMVFRGADPALGPSAAARCGLFASTWDLEATGCDPDPDRRRHESYGLHFFNALRGRDKEGKPLGPGVADLNRDGRVSLLEAHTRVRIAARSPDVPTTTSERFLRYVGLVSGEEVQVDLLEEDAVIAAMSEHLKLSEADLTEIEGLLARSQATLAEAEFDLRDATEREDQTFQAVSASVLARWPVLDDPWHPDFARTIEGHSAEIRRFLDGSREYATYREAMESVDRLDAFIGRLRVHSAPLERLVRARDNKVLAGRLKARGGPEWSLYEKLLDCERSLP